MTWAVRYERRCRVFEDIENACRFYHSIEPVDYQTQLMSDRTGIWDTVAWKSPPPGIRHKEDQPLRRCGSS
jgi:hypothetical protein